MPTCGAARDRGASLERATRVHLCEIVRAWARYAHEGEEEELDVDEVRVLPRLDGDADDEALLDEQPVGEVIVPAGTWGEARESGRGGRRGWDGRRRRTN